jgi:hypothetical protein
MKRFRLHFVVLCLSVVTVTAAVSSKAMGQEDMYPGLPSLAGLSGTQMVRGTVVTARGDRIAIKTDKGEAYQVAVTSNTRMSKNRRPFKLADLRTGDSVGAAGVLDAPAKTVHAMVVMVLDAEETKKAREALGKVFIAGKVTAIDELKLTILRPDNVKQVIAVDEGTSFRKGGRQIASAIDGFGPADGRANGGAVVGADTPEESITLSDIRVGDTVAGKGGLKGGTFVPSQLAVTDTSGHEGHRGSGFRSESAAAHMK